MLAELIAGVLAGLPAALGNMLVVLAAALVSVVAVSFFRGETTLFKTLYLVIIFAAGTFQPLLGVIAGISTVIMAQRRREWDQRELGTLFTLVFFAIASYYELVRIPVFTIAS